MSPSANALRILLVEDNPRDARLIRELLDDGPSDVVIDHVQTLAEAVSRTSQNGYDVALLDLDLPDSSGIDTVRAFTEASNALAVVVMTGLGDETLARNAIDGGVQDYVVKGEHDGEALELSIQNAIARHRRTRTIEVDSNRLRKRVSELEAILDASPLPMIVIDSEASVYKANREAAGLVGRNEGELDNLPVGDAIRCLHSLDNPKGCGFGEQCGRCELRLAAVQALEQGVTNRVECVREMRDADFVTSTRVLEVSTTPIDIDGRRMALICLNDLTDAKAANEKIRFLTRMLSISSDINELVANEKDSQRLMDETCRVVAENVQDGSAWIGLAELESGEVSIAASCGVDSDILEGLVVRCDDTPLGRGPMGAAIRENRTVSVRDTRTSPLLARWREVFKNRNLRSTIAVPLRVADRTVGALAVSSPLSDTFSPEVQCVLEEAVTDLGNALTAIQATHSAESSEERFRVLYHEAPVGYHELDETGTIVEVNTTEAEMLDYELDEMLGQPVWSFIPNRLAERSRRAVLARMTEGTQLAPLEWRFQRKDGSEVEVQIEDRQVTDESGRVVGLRATMQDISERKKMERTLQFTKFVIDRAGEAAMWLDQDARFTYFNDATCQLLGYDRSEIEGLSVPDVDPNYPVERWRELWRELRQRKAIRLESYVKTKDGRETPIEMSCDFVEFDGKEFCCAYLRDISERVRAQQVERTLRDILHAATTADDLRTLISEICGLLSGLIDTTNFYVALYDPKTETYRYPFYLDQYDDVDQNEVFRESNTLTDLVRRTGGELLVDEEMSRSLEQRGEVDLVGTPSPIWMGAPLVTEHGTIGVVAVQSYDDPKLYNEQDLELLGYAAGTIAIAVERRRAQDELRRHVVQQHLTSEASTAFMRVGAGQVDEAVERCLRDLGTFTDVDRSYVFLFSEDGDRLDNTHEWCAEGIEPQRDNMQGLTADDFPWGISIVAAGEVLDVPRVSDLPDEAGTTKAEFEAQNIQSLLCVPMVRGERVVGFVGLDSVGQERRWTADTITLLRTLGETLANALARHTADQALLASEERYRLLVERNPAGVYRISAIDGSVLDCNSACAKLFGYEDPNVLLGRNIEDFYFDLADRKPFRSAIEANGEIIDYELTFKTRDGEGVLCLVNAVLSTGEDGKPKVIEGTVVDITSRRQMEEQLRQAQKMQAIGRLAGGVAHDFNNLLQAFSGLTHALRRHSEDPDAYLERVADLNDLIKRGAQLTRQLLLFSRRETTEPERLDLNEVVHGTEKLLRHLLRENIRIAVVPAQGEVPVEADRGQLEQVIINLVVNAQEAMPAGGRLVIRTAVRSSGHTVMEVEDTGYGIPEDIREKIFDPFFTTKGDDGGTGLGLSVVHGIVERFGGTIQIESEVDQGSTFRITLPPVPDGEVATQEPTSGEDIASLRGSNQLILLVEDENEVRKGLTEMLTILGYRVEAVDRIASAREAISDGEFDLLVTDMVLPDGSGADLIKELRAIHPEVPVIAMSGYTTETPGLEAIAAGELRFIQKPFGLDEVAREVRSALETAVV